MHFKEFYTLRNTRRSATRTRACILLDRARMRREQQQASTLDEACRRDRNSSR